VIWVGLPEVVLRFKPVEMTFPPASTTWTGFTVVDAQGSRIYMVNESGLPEVAFEGLIALAPPGSEGVAENATVYVYGLLARIDGSEERMFKTQFESPEAMLLLFEIQDGNVLKV